MTDASANILPGVCSCGNPRQ